HPVNLAACRGLNKKRIDAATMVADDDAALIGRQRQAVGPPRPPQKFAQHIRAGPQQALKRLQSAAGKHNGQRDQRRDCQKYKKQSGRVLKRSQTIAFHASGLLVKWAANASILSLAGKNRALSGEPGKV